MRRAIGLLLVVGILLSGCTETDALTHLSAEIQQDEIEWGDAATLVIKNTGQGPIPAPITVEVLALNGTVVRTFEDVTGDRGIQPNGQVSVSWNGLNDAGRPVLWGTYTMRVVGSNAQDVVELLRPPHFAITVDPIPEETEAGDPMTFRVNNTGNVWLNGSLTVLAGRQSTIFYNNTVDVRLPPEGTYDMHWNGKQTDGEDPEPDKYLVAAQMQLEEDGPEPFAQDVFTLTEPSPG